MTLQTEEGEMTKVLVAVDGSGCAQRALDYVIAQSKLYPISAQVIYVNIIPDNYATLQAYLSRKENRQFTEKMAKAALDPAARKLARAGVAHKTHVAWGDIAPEIIRASRRLKCASIVMGTRGMGAVANLILGSEAMKVIHLSKLPVTLVR
jgi:nucleotide-binding universal stress UspA family protein